MQAAQKVAGCDPWQMALIHRLIRRGFERARQLVRPAGQEDEYVAAVAGYVQFHLDGLHAHHTTEDELLWPKLRARARMSEPLVERMEGQHEGIHEGMAGVATTLGAWRTSPGPESSAGLRDALDTLLLRLEEHLGEEERDVVPLIAEHITAREWEELGKAAFAKFTPAQRFTAMGEMLATATPDEAAAMTSELPPPVRLVWRLVGARRYERSMVRLRG